MIHEGVARVLHPGSMSLTKQSELLLAKPFIDTFLQQEDPPPLKLATSATNHNKQHTCFRTAVNVRQHMKFDSDLNH